MTKKMLFKQNSRNMFNLIMNKQNSYKITKLNDEDIIIVPEEGYEGVMIFLHGLGDSAMGMKKYFDPKLYPLPSKMKIILLTAAKQPVTIYGGRQVNSWFDIKNFFQNGGDFVDEDQVKKSTERIYKVLDDEAKQLNYKYEHIFLGGVSQGCAMALHVGLTYPKKLGGLIGIAGFLFPFTPLSEDKLRLPIFLGHGSNDFVIPELLAKFSYARFNSNKFNAFYKTYDVGHNVNEEEMNDIYEFIYSNYKY
jgi:phospholipase/carboxylesterase